MVSPEKPRPTGNINIEVLHLLLVVERGAQ